jgi:hypothetical protein
MALALVLSALAGCSGDPGSGPVAVQWDRDTCERCRMVLSDPKHAAQVRYRQQDGKSRVALFDDIGCALIWLEERPFKDAPATDIYVADWRTGEWIDARAALYLPGQVTPMGYGLGAQLEPSEDALSFDQAKAHVFETERRFNNHEPYGHHQHTPAEAPQGQ